MENYGILLKILEFLKYWTFIKYFCEDIMKKFRMHDIFEYK